MTSYYRSVAHQRRRAAAFIFTVAVLVAVVTIIINPFSSSHRTKAHAAPVDASAQFGTRLAGLVPTGIEVSVATLAPQSGQRLLYGQPAGMIDASDSKLDILECLLLSHEQAKQPIDSATDSLATSMIENSDNDAGQSLWNALGAAPAISACNARLGLRRHGAGPERLLRTEHQRRE